MSIILVVCVLLDMLTICLKFNSIVTGGYYCPKIISIKKDYYPAQNHSRIIFSFKKLSLNENEAVPVLKSSRKNLPIEFNVNEKLFFFLNKNHFRLFVCLFIIITFALSLSLKRLFITFGARVFNISIQSNYKQS